MDQFGRNPIDAMCFRLEINNTGEDTVLDCEALLTEVYYEGETSELGPVNLTWAGSSPGITKVNVRKGIPAYLDVATIDANNNVKACSLAWPNNRMDFFKRQGTYVLKVILTATNCVTCGPFPFRLNFDGNWRTSTLVAA
jgi:hypothetical protein